MSLFISVCAVPTPLQPDFGGLALRQSTHELLQFLEVERSLELSAHAALQGNNQSAMPPLKVFQPACIAHTRKLISTIDRAYSDAQLRTVLENECSMDKMFISVETGFSDYEACKRFAKMLTDARDAELKTGSTDGYESFCGFYHKYKTESEGGSKATEGNVEQKSSGGKTGTSEKAEEEKMPKQEKRVTDTVESERRLNTRAEANTTNNAKGAIIKSQEEKTEAAEIKAEIHKETEVIKKEAKSEDPAKEPPNQQDNEDMMPNSWVFALVGFGVVLFILCAVVIHSRNSQ